MAADGGLDVIRDLQITEEQAEALREVSAFAVAAQERYTLALAMVVRGHKLRDVKVHGLEGTTLTIEMLETEQRSAHG